jgi:hypothetical protein
MIVFKLYKMSNMKWPRCNKSCKAPNRMNIPTTEQLALNQIHQKGLNLSGNTGENQDSAQKTTQPILSF